MSTPQTATVYVTNGTNVTISGFLVHKNGQINSVDSMEFINVPVNGNSNSMTVNYSTGWGSLTTLDYWSLVFFDGTSMWGVSSKECQLQSGDDGTRIAFTISGTAPNYNLNLGLSGSCSTSFSAYGVQPST